MGKYYVKVIKIVFNRLVLKRSVKLSDKLPSGSYESGKFCSHFRRRRLFPRIHFVVRMFSTTNYYVFLSFCVYSVSELSLSILYCSKWDPKNVNFCKTKEVPILWCVIILFEGSFKCLPFKSFGSERTWWRVIQKRVTRTKFVIYVCIASLA